MKTCAFNLINHSELALDLSRLKRCAEIISSAEQPSACCEINLLLCTDEEMRRYHRLYRGCDAVTDVLSFTAEAGPLQPGQDCLDVLSHDIIVDINQIDRQKGTNSFEKELLAVFTHGLLHIFGYDHIRQQDRNIMQQRELYYSHLMEGD